MKLKIALTFLALSLCAAAQTVILSGNPGNPTITNNHPTQNVIGLVLILESAEGELMHDKIVLAPPATEGIVPGRSINVRDGMQSVSVASEKGVFKASKATIDSVIFADGSTEGQDTSGRMKDIALRLKAIHDVGRLIESGDWLSVEKMDAVSGLSKDPVTFSKKFAAHNLVQLRNSKSMAAALELAARYSSFPERIH